MDKKTPNWFSIVISLVLAGMLGIAFYAFTQSIFLGVVVAIIILALVARDPALGWFDDSGPSM